MNFDYTEEQTLLDNMVTSFVRDNYDWDTRCNIVKSEEGWKEENWKQFAELGLLGVPFDEAYGGLGGKSADLMIVMEQFGKGLVVEPYLPTVILAGGLISKLGSEEQKNSIIPEIISGKIRCAFAYAEPQSRFDLNDVKTSAVLNGDDYVLNGFKSVVFGAGMASHLIILQELKESKDLSLELHYLLLIQSLRDLHCKIIQQLMNTEPLKLSLRI